MVRLLAACLGLATLSPLPPSELSYDPLAWVVWGREIAHLGLDTSGGPSWKPLLVAFTTRHPSGRRRAEKQATKGGRGRVLGLVTLL